MNTLNVCSGWLFNDSVLKRFNLILRRLRKSFKSKVYRTPWILNKWLHFQGRSMWPDPYRYCANKIHVSSFLYCRSMFHTKKRLRCLFMAITLISSFTQFKAFLLLQFLWYFLRSFFSSLWLLLTIDIAFNVWSRMTLLSFVFFLNKHFTIEYKYQSIRIFYQYFAIIYFTTRKLLRLFLFEKDFTNL